MSRELRQSIDGSEQFLTGHRIIEARKRKKVIPCDWAHDDKKVRELLLKCFPKLKENNRQRRSAARWLRVINLYFKLNYTDSQVAEELEETIPVVKNIVQRIHRTIKGLNGNGTGARKGARGRPRK